MSGISVGTHGNHHYLADKKSDVTKVDQVTDQALAKPNNWVSFTLQTPDGLSERKFQVKAVRQKDVPSGYKVEVRRNSVAGKIRHAFSLIFSSLKFCQADRQLGHFSQDLFSRYTFSQVAIEKSSMYLKPAIEHLFNAAQISQASQPFIDDHGHHVVMAPSQVIDKLNAQPDSKEPMAVVFDLDNTLYTEGDYDGSQTEKHTKSLDPELPSKLKTFRQKFPNAKLVVITQSPFMAKGLVESKLAHCGYEQGTFDVINTKGDPDFKVENGRSPANKGERFLAIAAKEKVRSNWSPQRVFFFDDTEGHLDDLKKASDELSAQFEGYHVQSSHHFVEHKRQKIPSLDNGPNLTKPELAKLTVTEELMAGNLKPEQLHRYRMLRR
ncbi:hypothetical protein [Parashewanella tropica]|uniref:hypothetical protein n=1 Tax=Parashewanella tropica TaxID=2547970 RepID=UPI00105997E1|nr:hypothetical protein [Parashewanella tropica]